METLWLVNGRTSGLDPSDRGLAYGDGLFETMAAANGRIRWLEYHLERLEDGCRRLDLPEPGWNEVRDEIAANCPRSGRAIVKLIVTRGPGARAYRPPEACGPTRILGIFPWSDYPPAHYARGIYVKVCELRLGENPQLAGLKHLCRLEHVLAQLELRDSTAEQGLLLNTSGFVVGGSSSNLFAVRGAELLTPALARCGIRGVMRRVVLEAAVAMGLAVREDDFTLRQIEAADELFMTNALFGIWPVARLDGRRFQIGATTRELMRRLGYGNDA